MAERDVGYLGSRVWSLLTKGGSLCCGCWRSGGSTSDTSDGRCLERASSIRKCAKEEIEEANPFKDAV